MFVVDSTESELGILDLIQTFVETLDVCFRNVCELDMIFNMDRVHFILDEIVQGGMVRLMQRRFYSFPLHSSPGRGDEER